MTDFEKHIHESIEIFKNASAEEQKIMSQIFLNTLRTLSDYIKYDKDEMFLE